ncbi:hypothetical protein L7F22_023605 [Adiantum nelumboides]|nr:hypothetical protein [Adiantum nelumboides]
MIPPFVHEVDSYSRDIRFVIICNITLWMIWKVRCSFVLIARPSSTTDTLVQIWYASELPINKYIKIAATLSEKTVRDVALRCRWMLKRESEKRRKAEEQNPPKKSKDKKDKPVDSKPAVVPAPLRATAPVYAAPALSLESDDGIPNDGDLVTLVILRGN